MKKNNMNKLKSTQKTIGISIFIALASTSLTAIAGGFQLLEQNVTNLGNAFAGIAAEASDASTEYFNPAGMTLLDNAQVTGSAVYIAPSLNPNVENATTEIIVRTADGFTLKVPPISVTGNQDVSTSGPPIPAFHFVYPFNHEWAFGFGVDAPFGLQTNYADDSLARFLATKSSIQVVDIGPTIAYQLTPEFSLGAGVSAEYMTATFNQILPGPFAGSDGTFKNDGDNWGWGWHAGALYQFNQGTRVGLAYHSQVTHEIKGNSNVDIDLPSFNVPVFNFTVPSFTYNIPGKFTANTTLPDWADLSFYHDFNSAWAWLSDLEFTHWKTFDVITANFTGGVANNGILNLPSADLPFHFRNTWRVATGFNYKPCQKLTLRTGVAFDESPVSSDETRTFRLPDNNRFWVSLGASYIINSAFTVDAGYSHLFIKTFGINNTQLFNAFAPNVPFVSNPVSVALVENGSGNFDASANEVGVQLTWNIRYL